MIITIHSSHYYRFLQTLLQTYNIGLRTQRMGKNYVCPVQAWYLFIAGATLETDLVENKTHKRDTNAIKFFIFLKTIHNYYASLYRDLKISSIALTFFPELLVTHIKEYSNDLPKTNDQIATEMEIEIETKVNSAIAAHFVEGDNQPEPTSTYDIIKMNSSLVASSLASAQLKRFPNKEAKIVNLSLQPIMRHHFTGSKGRSNPVS